jgi:hypothetical protein
VIEIAVYVEGGGNTAGQKAELRRGFDALFAKQKSEAGNNRMSLTFICCGGRQEAYEAFKNAQRVNPQRINALLVDSETSIALAPKDADGEFDNAQDSLIRIAHLRNKEGVDARGQGDGWDLPSPMAPRIHLMVQCMEAWIVADPDKLEEFFKQKFKKNTLPKRDYLEQESKADIYEKLKNATKDTQKGEYGKIKHASKLLEMIRPEEISKKCPRFEIFRNWLNESIG